MIEKCTQCPHLKNYTLQTVK